MSVAAAKDRAFAEPTDLVLALAHEIGNLLAATRLHAHLTGDLWVLVDIHLDEPYLAFGRADRLLQAIAVNDNGDRQLARPLSDGDDVSSSETSAEQEKK